MGPLLLEDGDRQDHAQLSCQGGQGCHAGVGAPGMGVSKPSLFLGDTEIGTLEQFRGQNHLRTLGGRLPDQVHGLSDIGGQIHSIGGLEGGDLERANHQAGSCWVMQ